MCTKGGEKEDDVPFVRRREEEWACMCDQGGKKTNAHP